MGRDGAQPEPGEKLLARKSRAKFPSPALRPADTAPPGASAGSPTQTAQGCASSTARAAVGASLLPTDCGDGATRLLGSRHGARRQPLGRHLPRFGAHLGDQAWRVVPCRESGTQRCLKSHRITLAALPQGSQGAEHHPIHPHNPEEERTAAACAVLQDIRRCFRHASKSKKKSLGSQIISDARLGAR